jgi:hypothetical protein
MARNDFYCVPSRTQPIVCSISLKQPTQLRLISSLVPERRLDRKPGKTRTEALTAADFRRIALSLPEAVEGSHFGQADFRVVGRIFATLALESEGYGVVLLTAEQQAGMVEDEPEIFSLVPGGWGRKGATRVLLAKVAPDILEGALRTAWLRRAPKRLLGQRSKV